MKGTYYGKNWIAGHRDGCFQLGRTLLRVRKIHARVPVWPVTFNALARSWQPYTGRSGDLGASRRWSASWERPAPSWTRARVHTMHSWGAIELPMKRSKIRTDEDYPMDCSGESRGAYGKAMNDTATGFWSEVICKIPMPVYTPAVTKYDMSRTSLSTTSLSLVGTS